MGLGWEEAHHPWSENGVSFTSRKLLKWLIDIVFSMAALEPMTLGTVSELAEEQLKHSDSKMEDFKQHTMMKIDQCEEREEGDQWYDKQANLLPKLADMKGFKFEMLFSYSADDGTQCLGWYHGVVKDIVNSKIIMLELGGMKNVWASMMQGLRTKSCRWETGIQKN